MTTHAEDKGRFSFHSEKGGEYMVCLMTNSSNYYGCVARGESRGREAETGRDAEAEAERPS